MRESRFAPAPPGVWDASRLLVASGKGGVGTSMMATLAALTAAEHGERVLLVDATDAAGGGMLHHLFGVRPTQSLWSLSDPRARVEDSLIALDDRVTLVAGGASSVARQAAADHDRRSALARLTPLFADYSHVVFDGGSRLDTVTAVSDFADPAMLFVTSADRLALAATYALVKAATSRQPLAVISILFNRHGDAVAAEAGDFLVGACSHFLGRTIDVAGCIPDDPSLLAAVGAGMSVRDAATGSPAADAVRAVIARRAPARAATSRPPAMIRLSSTSRSWS